MMSGKLKKVSRREFIKTTGAAGIGSILSATGALAQTGNKLNGHTDEQRMVPTRPFGKTGENVSILALGADGNSWNHRIMRQAIKWGVTFWDTWDSDIPFGGGLNQSGVGNYFKQYPKDRKKVFLMSKTKNLLPVHLTRFLNKAIKVMNVDSIDFFVITSVSNIDHLDPEIQTWVAKAKAQGKIRYFGVSTHSNMENVMVDAAELGWIDGVMMTYNYRVMNSDHMKKAVDACQKKGLALIAMKTQAASAWQDTGRETETSLKLIDAFVKKGYTLPQAKLKAVWQNPHITSIASMMLNMTVLKSNVDAALDPTKLSVRENELFAQYAGETAANYCTGCSDICESAMQYRIPVSDVMRYIMYAGNYEDRDRGRSLFHQIPHKTRRIFMTTDFSVAEKRCPQKMPIARLMKEAVELFA